MSIEDHAALSEIGVIGLFISAVVGVLYLGVRWWTHFLVHLRERPRPRFWPWGSERVERVLSIALNVLFFGGILCILYGWLVEPRLVEVTRITLRSEKVRPETGRLRLVQLSDMHSDPEPLIEKKVVEIVNGLEPDLILLTGDYLNEEAALPVFRELAETLKSKHGVFAVVGNIDLAVLPPGTFDGLPLTVLDKESRDLFIRGTPVRVSGMEVGGEPYFARTIGALKPGPHFHVLLFHYSYLIDKAAEAGIDLYLCGHTHGGQVRLPFYGALITLSLTGKKHEAGLYRVGGTPMYVSRGLGMEGSVAPRVRFLCRPEIAVFDILPAGAR